MDDRFLHEGETLLCSQHATVAVYLRSVLRGLLDSLITGAVVDVVLFGLGIALGTSFTAWIYVLPPVIAFVAAIVLRYRVWRHATFRVTTERILIAEPVNLFHPPVHTVKWSQYQESSTGHRGLFDIFFLARPLHIRHGTADARLEFSFPSLRYAHDLKHYLDKIDSAVRKGDPASLKPFVAKPRGKRDA